MNEISFDNLTVTQPQERPAPEDIEIEGYGNWDGVRILIAGSVLKEAKRYFLTDTSRELGGVLVGGYYSHRGIPYTLTVGFIPATRGIGSPGSFRFTHEAWEEINKARDEKFPEQQIVGWYHTHPGYGIFLSGYDMFIHEHFFNLPHQYAMVVNHGGVGVFGWKDGKVYRCERYYRIVNM